MIWNPSKPKLKPICAKTIYFTLASITSWIIFRHLRIRLQSSLEAFLPPSPPLPSPPLPFPSLPFLPVSCLSAFRFLSCLRNLAYQPFIHGSAGKIGLQQEIVRLYPNSNFIWVTDKLSNLAEYREANGKRVFEHTKDISHYRALVREVLVGEVVA